MNEKCAYCGLPFEKHEVSRPITAPVPRVPCLMLQANFVPTKKKWLIWSIEHNAWWRAQHAGYTAERINAGFYTFEEACKIVKGANIGLRNVPNEAMIQI